MQKRDVCESPLLIMLQYPAFFFRIQGLGLNWLLDSRQLEINSDWIYQCKIFNIIYAIIYNNIIPIFFIPGLQGKILAVRQHKPSIEAEECRGVTTQMCVGRGTSVIDYLDKEKSTPQGNYSIL